MLEFADRIIASPALLMLSLYQEISQQLPEAATMLLSG